MDIDQLIQQKRKEYEAEMPTITVPAGVTLSRTVPMREPTIKADVGVPFLWALLSGLFAFGLAAFFSLAIDVALWGALVFGALVSIVVWFSLIVNWRGLWIAVEEITGADLNRDGQIGQPATMFELPTGPQSFRFGEIRLPPQLIIDWCQAAWDRQSLAYSAWEPRFALPDGTQGRERYQQFRAWLVKEGFAEEVGGNIGLRVKWKSADAVAFVGGFANVRPEDGTPLLEG